VVVRDDAAGPARRLGPPRGELGGDAARPRFAGDAAPAPLPRHRARTGGVEDDAALEDYVETTLLDLVALILGAGSEQADLARRRGRRAARLQIILAAIRTGCDAPDFSVRAVAARVGLSPRYIQDLLHETGRSLTERVLETRLQKARRLLADPVFADRRIIDIALASGFNDVSYFNRAFRRRFGATPTDVRQAARFPRVGQESLIEPFTAR
jgi:AraC-like DNA-binding protein